MRLMAIERDQALAERDIFSGKLEQAEQAVRVAEQLQIAAEGKLSKKQ